MIKKQFLSNVNKGWLVCGRQFWEKEKSYPKLCACINNSSFPKKSVISLEALSFSFLAFSLPFSLTSCLPLFFPSSCPWESPSSSQLWPNGADTSTIPPKANLRATAYVSFSLSESGQSSPLWQAKRGVVMLVLGLVRMIQRWISSSEISLSSSSALCLFPALCNKFILKKQLKQ